MSRLQHTAKKHPPRLLSTRCTPETVFVMVDTAARQASAQVEQSAQRAMHACMAGCTFCCHLPVDVTAPEALRMAAYLQQSLSPAALAVLHARIAATAMPGMGALK